MIGTSMPWPVKSRAWSGSGTRHPVSVVALSGRTTLASEPIISSGQAGAVPTAAQSSRRASRASARLRAIKAGHPPGTSPAR